MKTAEKIALAYGVSVLGAAAISYWRGRQSTEILTDAILHGGVAGTALTVVGFLMTESGESLPVLAMPNSEEAVGVGKLAEEGVKILASMNAGDVLAFMKKNGVKIDQVPENPSMINQDED